MENINFGDLAKVIKSIPSNTHYWLVRTMGGDYYNEYITRGYIAIGYNNISLDEIKWAAADKEKSIEKLKGLIEKKEIDREKQNSNEDEEYNAQYASAQLMKFYKDINVGDYIVMPGVRSEKVAIAVVESDAYEDKNVSKLTGVCNFGKRRKIKLIRQLIRTKMTPKMQLMFNSRHIISNVDGYAQYIDNCISDFYTKEGLTYLVLRVKEEDDIPVDNFSVINDLMALLNEYSYEKKVNASSKDISMKIAVQSPGDIALIAICGSLSLFLIGLFIVLIKGGDYEYGNKFLGSLKLHIPKSSEGIRTILESISDFMDRTENRKRAALINEKLKNMDIDSPKDIDNLLGETKKDIKHDSDENI